MITEELYIQYDILVQAAKKDGENIKLISGFRSYPDQKDLYDDREVRKVRTAKPGCSQHQNGIAIDINTRGFTTDLYKWMKTNAPKYGFIRTVTSEDWHWEYKPVEAKKYGYKMPSVKKG
jgi:LAS superfamily LD-carboxypeptidase LdcB